MTSHRLIRSTVRDAEYGYKQIVVYQIVVANWRARCSLYPEPFPTVPPHQWYLDWIATREGYEGQGFGRLLIDAVRAWARNSGYKVRTNNAVSPAYGFYERTGCIFDPKLEEFIIC